jgi:two-component system response regulator
LVGYRLGANSFVRKPVAFGDLMEAARQIGRYWLGLNEVPSPLTLRRVTA